MKLSYARAKPNQLETRPPNPWPSVVALGTPSAVRVLRTDDQPNRNPDRRAFQALLALLPLKLRVRLDRHAFTPTPTPTSTSMAPSPSAIRSPSLAVVLQECPAQTASAKSAGNPFPTISCSPLCRVRHARKRPAQSEGAVTALRAPPLLPCGFAAADGAASSRYRVLRAARLIQEPPTPARVLPLPSRSTLLGVALNLQLQFKQLAIGVHVAPGVDDARGFLECLTTARPLTLAPPDTAQRLYMRMGAGSSSTQAAALHAHGQDAAASLPTPIFCYTSRMLKHGGAWRSRAQGGSRTRVLDDAWILRWHPMATPKLCSFGEQDGQMWIGTWVRLLEIINASVRLAWRMYRGTSPFISILPPSLPPSLCLPCVFLLPSSLIPLLPPPLPFAVVRSPFARGVASASAYVTDRACALPSLVGERMDGMGALVRDGGPACCRACMTLLALPSLLRSPPRLHHTCSSLRLSLSSSVPPPPLSLPPALSLLLHPPPIHSRLV
ncbi:hypothetical protein C8R45DRAFT_1216484 [Mycena sanguinolenta]|nr:hypothetical protein C8R45DRAFT_1216484 [Mycena sanguinolenta]